MSGFTGTRQALRFALKRDRVIIPLCLTGLIGWMAMYVVSYTGLYGTQAELDALYNSVAGNPAIEALSGPTGGLRSLGGAIAWDSTPALSIICAVYAMFSVIRHSRAEEEDARTDLLLASGSGRLAPLAAALIVTSMVLTLAGTGFAAVLIIGGLAVAPSFLLALGITGFALVMAGTTAVFAQITTKARAARGLVGVVIGVSWLMRAIGDTSGGTLTWFSPLGWVQETRAFWDDRWWPLLLFIIATAITVWASFWLLGRRDIGSGLIQPRPGPAHAAPSILHPLGFSFRLQRATIFGWTAMLCIYGLAIGTIGNNIEDILESSPAFSEAFASLSANLLDSYFASILTVIALLGAGFTISAVLRPAAEENRDRVAMLLAEPLGRVRWAVGHVLIAWIASALMIAAAGLAIGIGLGVVSGDFSQAPALFASGFVRAPAMWLTGSLAVLLFGISSRLTPIAWGVLAIFVLIWTLASFGNLPDWVVDLSPFSHIPAAPAVYASPEPLAVMTGLAVLLTAAGLFLWRRRDLA